MNFHLVTSKTPQSLLERGHAIHVESQFSPWKLSTFADCFTKPYYGVLALDGEALVGYAIVLEVLDEATLMDIAVTENERGKGVGKALVDFVLLTSKKHGMSEIWLEVRESNTSAIALYEKKGFEHIETRKYYYATSTGKEHAKIMKWTNLTYR